MESEIINTAIRMLFNNSHSRGHLDLIFSFVLFL